MELTLFLDHDCNLRCDYCYGGRKLARPMPAAVMKRAVDLALADAPADLGISFFGGEPLLQPGLVEETVAYVEERARVHSPASRLCFGMNTNGTLLDERAAALLAPPRRWDVFVSCDGPPAVHDRHRVGEDRRGSHAAVKAGLGTLRAHAIPFTLVAVVRPATAARLGDCLRALLDEGPRAVHLTPDLRVPWTDEAIGDLRAGLRELAEVWMDSFRHDQAIAVEPLHTKILTHLYGGMPCPPRCTLAGQAFAVAPSGRIYPCAQMIVEDTHAELVVGTVSAGFDRAKLAELQRQKDRVEATCAPCALRHRCESHCGCHHWLLTGELGRINATLCELEESFIAAADHTATVLSGERCPSFLRTYYEQRYGRAGGSRPLRLDR